MQGEMAAAMGSMPEQHEDQLELGFRMIKNAFNSKVQVMEQELRGLRLSCDETKSQAAALQKKNSALEVELVEGHQRSQQLAEENKELFKNVQQLRKQLSRLEGLKKKVMESISDEQSANVDESRLYMRDDYLRGALPLTSAAMGGPGMSATAPVTIGTAPMPIGPLSSTNVPQSEPTAYQPSSSNWPTSTPSPMSTTAPAEASAVIDGKAFFRQARNNLSYEAFNEFLANIKRLNNQQQTREETLEGARRIFGPDKQHLYRDFEQLLNRHAV